VAREAVGLRVLGQELVVRGRGASQLAGRSGG